MILIAFIFGFIIGGGFCAWAAWEFKKDAMNYHVNITLDKEDLIDLVASDDEMDKLIEDILKKK